MKITSLENGPNIVAGAASFTVDRAGTQEVLDRANVALCRCGHSKDKPFCDGTHREIGFEARAAEIEITLG